MSEEFDFSSLPLPPEGSAFKVRGVKKIAVPHPFVVGARLVGHASDHFSGMLGEAAIESAEKKGIHCEWRGCQLSFREHTNDLTLIIEVEVQHDLNKVPGLHQYLLSIKEQAESLGIKAFAFPMKEQRL